MIKNNFAGIALLTFILLTIWTFAFNDPDGKLHIDFLDIGQGDSIYFLTSDGHDGLIDGGPNDKVLRELGEAMPVGDRVIDLMVATHPDADHIGGLAGVLDRYDVKEIWLNGAVHTTQTYLRFLEAVKKEKKLGATVKVITRGDRKDFGDTSLQVLAPFESFEGKQPKEQNEGTIVARLLYNDFSLLLTGDLEYELENKLIANANDIIPLKSTVLKVGHHGSGGSSGGNFVNEVKPKIAVISVGKDNRYGHPAKRVLELLEKNKIQTYRTDIQGRIEIISDGLNYQVKTLH